jgi:hypothetical protein
MGVSMRVFLNSMGLGVLLLSLSACGNGPKTQWYQDYSGNQIEIVSGTMNSHTYSQATNHSHRWVGVYKGEEEKVSSRKDLLNMIVRKEAAKVCGGSQMVTFSEDTSYNMTDSSDAAYGGGLLGVLLNNAFSSYANIPVSASISYDCKGGNPFEKKDQQMKAKGSK